MHFDKAVRALNEKRRAADLELLWPACVDLTGDVNVARDLFLQHTAIDSAWLELTKEQISEIVGKLEVP
jgi:hypothetical protein